MQRKTWTLSSSSRRALRTSLRTSSSARTPVRARWPTHLGRPRHRKSFCHLILMFLKVRKTRRRIRPTRGSRASSPSSPSSPSRTSQRSSPHPSGGHLMDGSSGAPAGAPTFFVGEAEIRAVVERAAPRLSALVNAEACAAIARRARGTPREALRLLERARDLAQASARAPEKASVEARHVEDAAERLGIDSEGLRVEERRILEVLLARGRPMGIESIAATLRLDPLAVRLVHEPYLVGQGYVARSFRGREATAKARLRFARNRARAATSNPFAGSFILWGGASGTGESWR